MSPEEKSLLERTLKLSEENNRILRRIQTTARWAFVWGIIKVLIILVPLGLGFIYFQPLFGVIGDSFRNILETFGAINSNLSR